MKSVQQLNRVSIFDIPGDFFDHRDEWSDFMCESDWWDYTYIQSKASGKLEGFFEALDLELARCPQKSDFLAKFNVNRRMSNFFLVKAMLSPLQEGHTIDDGKPKTSTSGSSRTEPKAERAGTLEEEPAKVKTIYQAVLEAVRDHVHSLNEFCLKEIPDPAKRNEVLNVMCRKFLKSEYQMEQQNLDRLTKPLREEFEKRVGALKLIMRHSQDPEPDKEMIPIKHIPPFLLEKVDATAKATFECIKRLNEKMPEFPVEPDLKLRILLGVAECLGVSKDVVHQMYQKKLSKKVVNRAVPNVATGIKRTASAAGLSKTPSPKKQALDRASS